MAKVELREDLQSHIEEVLDLFEKNISIQLSTLENKFCYIYIGLYSPNKRYEEASSVEEV
jgi:hypothetical protein